MRLRLKEGKRGRLGQIWGRFHMEMEKVLGVDLRLYCGSQQLDCTKKYSVDRRVVLYVQVDAVNKSNQLPTNQPRVYLIRHQNRKWRSTVHYGVYRYICVPESIV